MLAPHERYYDIAARGHLDSNGLARLTDQVSADTRLGLTMTNWDTIARHPNTCPRHADDWHHRPRADEPIFASFAHHLQKEVSRAGISLIRTQTPGATSNFDHPIFSTRPSCERPPFSYPDGMLTSWQTLVLFNMTQHSIPFVTINGASRSLLTFLRATLGIRAASPTYTGTVHPYRSLGGRAHIVPAFC